MWDLLQHCSYAPVKRGRTRKPQVKGRSRRFAARPLRPCLPPGAALTVELRCNREHLGPRRCDLSRGSRVDEQFQRASPIAATPDSPSQFVPSPAGLAPGRV